MFLDNAEELVSLLLGLLGETGLSLEELTLSGILHILEHLLLVLQIPTFLLTCGTLALFKGTLGTEGIDLSLSISSLLLEFTEACDLTFLLLLDTLELSGLLFLTLSLRAVVINDLLLELLLLYLSLLLDLDGALVGNFHLSNHGLCTSFLGLKHALFIKFQLLSLLKHLLHLTLAHLLLLDTI